MKNLKIVLGALALIMLGFSANAQSCCSKKGDKNASCAKKETTSDTSASAEDGAATATAVLVSAEVELKKGEVKVYGNCGMCKRRIEGALANVEGIASAEWDMETKMLAVDYDEAVISLDDIEKKIATVGHDTDKFRSEDAVYEKLHGCCKYDRPESK